MAFYGHTESTAVTAAKTETSTSMRGGCCSAPHPPGHSPMGCLARFVHWGGRFHGSGRGSADESVPGLGHFFLPGEHAWPQRGRARGNSQARGLAQGLPGEKRQADLWHAAFHRTNNGTACWPCGGHPRPHPASLRASTPLYGEQAHLFHHKGTKNARRKLDRIGLDHSAAPGRRFHPSPNRPVVSFWLPGDESRGGPTTPAFLAPAESCPWGGQPGLT